MPEDDQGRQEQVLKAFEQTLNRHGYSFQYSVVKAAEQLYPYQSPWQFEATEFPVEVQGATTRIDILLRHRQDRPFYLLAECKRANPALSNWCFASSPYIDDSTSYNSVVLERAHLDERNYMTAFANRIFVSDKSYHLALEVKSGEKGDASGSTRGAIEDAITQILRGLNGMVELFAKNLQFFGTEKSIDLLPVVFTTAQLWTTDADLSAADVTTGNIDLSTATFTRKEWVLYQYHMSPGLKHSSSPSERLSTLGELMRREYIRSVPIVSTSGIARFLEWAGTIRTR